MHMLDEDHDYSVNTMLTPYYACVSEFHFKQKLFINFLLFAVI